MCSCFPGTTYVVASPAMGICQRTTLQVVSFGALKQRRRVALVDAGQVLHVLWHCGLDGSRRFCLLPCDGPGASGWLAKLCNGLVCRCLFAQTLVCWHCVAAFCASPSPQQDDECGCDNRTSCYPPALKATPRGCKATTSSPLWDSGSIQVQAFMSLCGCVSRVRCCCFTRCVTSCQLSTTHHTLKAATNPGPRNTKGLHGHQAPAQWLCLCHAAGIQLMPVEAPSFQLMSISASCLRVLCVGVATRNLPHHMLVYAGSS